MSLTELIAQSDALKLVSVALLVVVAGPLAVFAMVFPLLRKVVFGWLRFTSAIEKMESNLISLAKITSKQNDALERLLAGQDRIYGATVRVETVVSEMLVRAKAREEVEKQLSALSERLRNAEETGTPAKGA